MEVGWVGSVKKMTGIFNYGGVCVINHRRCNVGSAVCVVKSNKGVLK